VIDSQFVELALSQLLIEMNLPSSTRLLDLGPNLQRLVWKNAETLQREAVTCV